MSALSVKAKGGMEIKNAHCATVVVGPALK